MSTTPYMNLTLPDPTVTTGPEWANELNAALAVVDNHDHTPGKGTLVPTAGLNINEDLSFQSNAANDLQKTAFTSQGSSLPVSNVNAVYVINGDLWYNNDAGTPVQVTSGSSIASSSSPIVPAGIISPWGGASAPSGYLLCDGTAVSRTTFSDLFAAIGTTYGVGDGSTTFNTPNAAGRTLVGAGTYTDPVSGSITRTLGTALGAANHVLTSAQMPSHTHVQNAHSHVQQGQNTGAVGGAYSNVFSPLGTEIASATSTQPTTATNQNTGGGGSHNNMQPSLVVNYIVKT